MMHGNSRHSALSNWVARDDYLKDEKRSKLPLVYAGLFIILIGFSSYHFNVVAMWWRSSVSGAAVAISSTLFTTLFAAVAQAPGSFGTYVDPAVLDACPGYVTRKVTTSRGGSEVTIQLGLPAGKKGCAVFGPDVEELTLVATYETDSRLHVKITDSKARRYEVPESVFPRPKGSFTSPKKSDLKFSYTTSPNPFSFTISRASTNEVLFTTAGHSIIFEDQYLRVKTALPQSANIYGLGETTEWFQLDTDNGGNGTVRTLWSRDAFGIPQNSNLYGNHPLYYDHRTSGTHGVLLLNSNGMDIKLNQTSPSDRSLEYNVIGGVLDFYFLAGSDKNPAAVAKQYSDLAGRSVEFPYWSLGFHQCRFGYKNFVDVANVIDGYKNAGIPLETMWTDIDYMQDRLIFTVDPKYFPLDRLREIVSHLHANKQKYIVMTDPAVAYHPDTGYGALDRGLKKDVFLKNQNGSTHLGVVWPGVTAYPDWFHPNTQDWWTGEFKSFYSADTGVDIDGVWIDMNEPASFCEFPCNDPYGAAVEQKLPPARDTLPPSHDAPIFSGSSSNTTVSPRSLDSTHFTHMFSKRQSEATVDPLEGVTDPLLNPPYRIANTAGALSSRTAYTNIVQANNNTQYDTHNLYGSMMSTATRNAMISRRPNRRPLIITRSTFAGAGRHVGKWLGDNLSTWDQYRRSIGGMLNFASIFNIPMVGSDVCGFGDNTTETLCARWAMLGAFNPFYRNHNIDTGISQEFYVWPLTTEAAKAAIDTRYRLLDYLYTAFHSAHVDGSTVLSPLWYQYPKDTTTYPIDLQFFYGPSLLVSPVTEENSTTVKYYLPADTWYSFADLSAVSSKGEWVTQQDVSYTQIPLHIKGGSVVPLRNESAMTTTELRKKPFSIVVAPDAQGKASGVLYVDDGETIDPAQSKTTQVTFTFSGKKLSVGGRFGYDSGFGVGWKTVKIAGVDKQPARVSVDGRAVKGVKYDAKTKVLEVEVAIDRLRAFELVLA